MKEATQLETLHDKAGDVIQSQISGAHEANELNELFFMLGGLNMANSIAKNLDAGVILGLQKIRDEQLYRGLGYMRFDEFLDDHPRSPMKYKRFNYVESVFENVGAVGFDLLSDSGLSMRQLKQLEAGDIEIQGNEIVIGGGERLPIGEHRAIKAVIEQLVKDKRDAKEETEKAKKNVEKLDGQLKHGQSEYETLQRKYDDATQLRPFDRSLMMSVHWQLNLLENISTLPDAELKKRGYEDLKLLAGIWFRLREAYKIDLALTDFTNRVANDDLDRKIEEILADGDLSEVEE